MISAGFWPGKGDSDAVFYTYAAPEPAGFSTAKIIPAAASYNTKMSEYFLPYEEVRKSSSPRQALLDFAESTYVAAATLGDWDRAALERTSVPK